jgi:pimeloyl-ACP methyl ester carboxylesterase
MACASTRPTTARSTPRWPCSACMASRETTRTSNRLSASWICLARFIAVDVRGRGLSDRDPNRAYSPDVYVGDMIALLNELGIDRVALMGTSMGGLMAMIMSQALKDRISGIVLNDVGPAVNPAGVKRIAAYTSGVRSFPDWTAAANAIRASQQAAFPDFGTSDWVAFAHQTCRETDQARFCSITIRPLPKTWMCQAQAGRSIS